MSDADMWHHAVAVMKIFLILPGQNVAIHLPLSRVDKKLCLILWLVTLDWTVSWYWSQSHNNDICVLTRRSILGSDVMMKSDCSLFSDCSMSALSTLWMLALRHPDVILMSSYSTYLPKPVNVSRIRRLVLDGKSDSNQSTRFGWKKWLKSVD